MNTFEITYDGIGVAKKDNVKIFIVLCIVLVLLFLAAGPVIFTSDWKSSTDFHACIEISSSFIAFLAAVACLMYYFGFKNRYFLIVGLGFFICGSEDLIHGILGFERIFRNTNIDWAADIKKFIPGTYVAGRSMLAISIIAAAIFEKILKSTANAKREAILFSIIAVITGGGATALAFSLPLPDFIYPDKLISRPVDFMSSILFMIAFIFILRRFLKNKDIFSGMLLVCIMFNIGGQVYMSFSKQLFDVFFDTAHWANIISYCIPVLGITIESLNNMKTAVHETAEHKRIEKSLRESEEKYRELANLLPQTVFELDIERNFIFTNRYGFESTGYTQEDMEKGINATQIFIPEDRERVKQNIGKVLKGNKNEDHEYTIMRKDGSTFPALVYSNAIIQDGKTVGIRGIVLDITERKQADEEREKLLHDLGERVKEINCLYDLSKIVDQPDTTMEEIFERMVYLIPPGWRYPDITCARVVFENKKYKTDNFKTTIWKQSADIEVHGKKAGTIEVYYLEEKPELDEGPFLKEERNLINALAERLGKITARMGAEEALRESEEKFRAISDSAGDAIIMMDSDELTTFWNKTAEKIFGYTSDEIIGKELHRIIVPDRYFADFKKGVGEFKISGKGKIMEKTREITAIKKDGTIFPVELSVSPVKIKDKWNAIGIIRDITARKRDEEEIAMQSVELKRSNAELQQFAYIASHDMQEPLRKVQAFGSRLESILGDEIPGKGRDYLIRMQNAANRMSDLIESLLIYSRVTTNAQPFTKVDLKKIARTVISDLEISIEKSGGTVDVGKLPTINSDKIQIRQLLQNLIGNGLKYHRDDEPPVIKISGQCESKKENTCEIIIEDNGIGIDEKYFERIFQPFQRLHGRGKFEGTGIGLAICKKIVDRHNGTITVESEPGKGSTFTITLPA